MVVILQYISTNLNCSQLAGRKQLGGHSFSKSELIALMLGEYDIDIYVMYIYIYTVTSYVFIYIHKCISISIYIIISIFISNIPTYIWSPYHPYLHEYTHTCICIYIYISTDILSADSNLSPGGTWTSSSTWASTIARTGWRRATGRLDRGLVDTAVFGWAGDE